MSSIKVIFRYGYLIGPRSFYREALLVMLPVIGQQLISTLFIFADNLMVGQVSAQTLAGVAIANKYFLVFNGIFWGITGAAGLLISQYHGANDRDECQRLFSLQIIAGAVVSLVFTLALLLFPRFFLQLFVRDEMTIQAGLAYLPLVSLSYLPAAIAMIGMFSLRAVGYTRLPLLAGFLGIMLNLLLNWVLIFGKLGLPAMGARGAALATLLARLMEASFYIFWIGTGRTLFTWQLRTVRQMRMIVWRMVLAKAIPLTVNELFFTVGLNLFFWSYARMASAAVPAIVISEQAYGILTIVFGGMAAGVSVLVGKRLGAGDFAQARIHADRLTAFHGGLALVMGLVALLVAPLIPQLFAVTPELRTLAGKLIMIQALFLIPTIIYNNIFFVLRAGGDMRSAFILDTIYPWLLPIPLAVLLATHWPSFLKPGLPLAFLAIQFVLNLRLLPALWYLRRGRWIQNLTELPISRPVVLPAPDTDP